MVQDVFQYCFKQGKTRQYLHPHQKPIKKNGERKRPPFQYHLM